MDGVVLGTGGMGVGWALGLGKFHCREQKQPSNVSESLTAKSMLKHNVPV